MGISYHRGQRGSFLGYSGVRLRSYTFLCALPPARRGEWASKMASLLRPGGLLLTLQYPLPPPAELAAGTVNWHKGPPFAYVCHACSVGGTMSCVQQVISCPVSFVRRNSPSYYSQSDSSTIPRAARRCIRVHLRNTSRCHHQRADPCRPRGICSMAQATDSMTQMRTVPTRPDLLLPGRSSIL
jgi:hypothetical protein